MKWLLVCVVASAACSVAAPAWAQDATLSGRVIDQSGAVVPQASVTALNESTGAIASASSNDQGLYAITFLPPGTYKVSVQMAGFRSLVHSSVPLEVGQAVRLNFRLETAPTQETITVVADAIHVNATDGSVGTIVNRQFVERIPMNGRSLQSLILLTPGITTNSPQSSATVGASGEFSVNGQRTESNRFSIDGVSANNGTYVFGYETPGSAGTLPTATATGTTQSLVSLDALQEFRVSSSSYSAELGRSPGGQFSFVTRSGTNAAHGSLFEYLRNDALDASDWFNNRLGAPKAKERQNDFGGTFGGPVMIPGVYKGQDRTFFFLSYEGARLSQPLAASLVYVPSLVLRQQAAPALRGALGAYPLPSGADLPNGLAEYVLTDSVPSRLDSTGVRLDHTAASFLRIFARYSYTPSNTTTRTAPMYATRQFRPQSYTFGATSTLAHSISNEFRLGYNHNEGSNTYTYATRDGATPTDLLQTQGIDSSVYPTAWVFVATTFPGYPGSTVGTTHTRVPQRQINITDATTLSHGTHQIKLGVDLLRTSSDLLRNDPSVAIFFRSASALVAGQADVASVNRFAETHPVFTNFGAYVQDEWRLAARFGLSLGIRWDLSPSPGVTEGHQPRVLSGTVAQPSTLALAPEGTPLWKTTYNNIAPRFGMAFIARDSESYTTVLRAGSGIYFDNGQNVGFSAYDGNPGSLQAKSYRATRFPLSPAQLDISLADSLVPPYVQAYQIGDPAYPYVLPYTLHWNLSAEQVLLRKQSITLSYVGARGKRQVQEDELDFPTADAVVPVVYLIRNGQTSSYDALQVQFQRRLSDGLQAMAAYTWSHSIDYASTNAALSGKRGDSDYDLRHSVDAAVTYEIPAPFKNSLLQHMLGHWSADGRFAARSGFPVSLNGNLLSDPVTGQQYYGGVDLVPGVPIYLNNSAAPGGRQINPAAFQLPKGSQSGTAGRNVVRGFGATQFDATLRRDVKLASNCRLQFRLEAFNLLNHPNFGVINTTLSNPQFGQATQMLNSSLGGLSAI